MENIDFESDFWIFIFCGRNFRMLWYFWGHTWKIVWQILDCFSYSVGGFVEDLLKDF